MNNLKFCRVLQRSSRRFCTPCRSRTYATNSNPALAVGTSATETLKKTAAPAAAAAPTSSCLPDTVLQGLNYLKGQTAVLARPDDQYPDWLWSILQPKVWPDDGPGGKAERVQRREENRQRIKDRNFMQTQ